MPADASGRAASTARDHLVGLPSALGDWSLWRCASLRATGLPASLVLGLGAPEAAAAVDRLLDAQVDADRARERLVQVLYDVKRASGEEAVPAIAKALKVARKGKVPAVTGTAADAEIAALTLALAQVEAASGELRQVFATSQSKVSLAVRAAAAHPRLREAVTWQNRAVLETGFASLLKSDPDDMRARDRGKEELVASYLQRYCTKNDTIGFFGPVGWARLGGADGVVCKPGPTLLAERGTHFEQWPIDDLAKRMSSDPRLEPWMSPRRFPFVRIVDGATVRSAVNGKHTLTPSQALVLGACAGAQTARRLAAALTAAQPDTFASEADVFEALRGLRDKQLIAWAFEVPLSWNPDAALRSLLRQVEDDALREELVAPLDELDAARSRVSDAAGDTERLQEALGALDATFTRVTGRAATRNAGSMYAARQLVFEDCRRDLEVSLGSDILAALGPALSLVLTSGRWMTYEVARLCEQRFRAIHDELLARSRTGTVALDDLWFRAQRVLFGEKESPLVAVTGEVERRWAEILVYPPDARDVRFDSAALSARVEDRFAAPRSGWKLARQHSPDVMIAAASVEHLQRGDYTLVLGEIHVGTNTLDSAFFLAEHPHPEELVTAHGRDLPEALALPVYSKDWLRITVRTNRGLVVPWHRYVESGFDVAPGARERVLSLSDLVVHDIGGVLVVRGPDGFELGLIDFLGENLSLLTASALRILPRASHTPRISIDGLVVSRESWRVMPSEIPFAYEATPEARFVAARRWARRLGLPRFCYAKSSIEVKPVYVDLESPLFVNIFAKLIRKTKEHVSGETPISITEMLPGPHQLWVTDAAGERFTSELRIVAVDESERRD